jgi:hypothetical protein
MLDLLLIQLASLVFGNPVSFAGRPFLLPPAPAVNGPAVVPLLTGLVFSISLTNR